MRSQIHQQRPQPSDRATQLGATNPGTTAREREEVLIADTRSTETPAHRMEEKLAVLLRTGRTGR
jgi:hypothetical protein